MRLQVKLLESLVLVAVAALMSGCRKDSPANEEVAFAVIDGEPITVSFVSNTVMLTARIAELAKRPIHRDMFARWGNNYAMKIIPQLVEARLFDRELQRMGIAPTAASDAATLDNYNRMARLKATSLDDLGSSFGDLEGHFRRQFVRESRFNAYYEKAGASNVSDEEIAAKFRNVTNEIRRLRRIDARARSNALAAWERLNAGEPWRVVATNYTEDALLDEHFANYWQSWDEFELEEVESEELKQSLARLRVGGFTKPIEIEEGLVIVRLNRREGKTLHCSRILFRMAVQKEMPSREEVIKGLVKKKSSDLQAEILKKARHGAKVEYPLGKRFTYVIWPMPSTPAKANNNPGKARK